MSRPGDDRRHRVDRLPGRVGPRSGREAQGARRLEGDDDDVDLRPPDHPGRRVGLVPAPHRPAAPGRGRLLRVGRRGARACSPARRSRTPTPPPPRRRRWPAAGAPAAAPAAAPPDSELLQAVQAATSLLKAYRTHGHLAARLDPLGKEPKGDPAIEPENLNLTPELMAKIPASILRIGVEGETLLEALPRMRDGLLRHDRLPDRAPLLAPAAHVAAGDDRDRGAPHPARRSRRSARCCRGWSRCSSSSASSRGPTSARRCSRSRASTRWSR